VSASRDRITRASGVMRGPLFEETPNASPRITVPTHNHAGFASPDPRVMRDAAPIGAHQRISDAFGPPSERITPHHPASDAVALALRVIGEGDGSPAPRCTSCGAPVDDPEAVLCGSCYQARRSHGRVLPFDPDRRRRTEARLAGRPCGTCGATSWRVNGRGDAACRGCFPESSSSPARPLAGRPVSPGAPGAGRGGVSPRGAA
jgi:hypothetical protein